MQFDSIVEAIYRHSLVTPSRTAVGDDNGSLSYELFFSKIYLFAKELQRRGVAKGDHVIVENTQDSYFSASIFAVQLSGAVSVPIENGASTATVSEIIKETNAALYIGILCPVDSIPNVNMNILSEYTLCSLTDINIDFPKGTDIAEILFSTGTTGKSKGIELSHSAIAAVAENVVIGVEMKDGNVELITSPLSHSHGLRRHYANLIAGNTAIITKNIMLVKQIFALINNYHITSIAIVPAALRILLKISKGKLAVYKDQLDYIQLATAPLTEAEKNQLCELLPKTRLYNIYGSTEAGCSTFLDFNKYRHKKNCVGKPAVNANYIVVDDNRNPISSSPNHTGLLACSGKMLMNGYLNNPELTAETMSNGFVYSNDEGYIDDEGFIYVIGRRGSIINAGGIKIAPEEIEEIAVKYTHISDCACIGKANALGGQTIVLFVSVKPGIMLDKTDYFEFLSNSLDKNKRPREIRVVDKIPRTFNGKIERKKLSSTLL